MKFGIVQGRLTQSAELQCFPKYWGEEFLIRQDIPGLDYIELIAEREHNPDNPIWLAKMPFIRESPIVCDDYIINHGLVIHQVCHLIDQCHKWFGTRLIVLPMMEEAENSSREKLIEIELYAAKNNIQIALETVEDDHPFNIVYDTGNRVDAGLNPARDIRRLGKRIAHVHIKDKDWKGDNVLLGTGDVDFKEVCQALKDIGYDGTMTFETVRGKDPIRTAKYNLEFIKFFLSEAQ